MSAGHTHAGEDELDTSIATPGFILECAALIAAAIVDSEHDVPWLANRSIDYSRVYKDRRLPDILPKTGIDTRKSLPWHEIPEGRAMDLGLVYLPAHNTIATPLERAEVERQKPGDPDIWKAYTEEMDGFISEVDKESLVNVPDDMDLRVFEGYQKILDVIMAALERTGMSKPKRFFRATAALDLANSSGRIIRYRFSTPAVARDQHTISAWTLDNYRMNPVFLWAHGSREPPIGKVIEVEDNKGYLDGSVEYAERDVYPFADTIFQLVRGGYINAVSTSWDPIDWKFTTDRARPGGIDFKLVDLLELSQVPVPALPVAVATARGNGIDVAPLREWAEKLLDEGGMILVPRAELENLRRAAGGGTMTHSVPSAVDWKVGASRNLPIDEDSAWDAAAAEQTIFAHCGFDGDKPDTALARKAFLLYDATNPKLRSSYKLPFAKIADGRLIAVAAGIRAAALLDADGKARAVIDHYEGKMSKSEKARAERLAAFKRDLGHVCWLAYLLSDLDSLEDCVEWEAELEADGSPIPGQIAAVKKHLGDILVAMAGEEVSELMDDGQGDDLRANDVRAKRAVLLGLRGIKISKGHGLGVVMDLLAAVRANLPAKLAIGDSVALVDEALARAGKVLSGKNHKSLSEAHDAITRGCDMIRSALEEAGGVEDDPENSDDEQRGIRRRRAAALKHKVALVK
jgi:hypothetical protein